MSKRKLLVMPLVVLGLAAGVGCERKIVNETAPNLAASACFTCHGDQEFDLVAAQQQWQNSIHASGNNINRNRNYASQYQTCERCHTNEGFIATLTGVPATGEYFTAIGCFTCHQPHTNGNLNVRVSGPTTLANGVSFDYGNANLCARCHQSRENVLTYVFDGVKMTTRFGPHYSDQGDMLAGTGGYEYTGYVYENSAHTGVATDGCIDCHMTGTQANLVGGHTWNMRNEEHEMINLVGCNQQACHGATGALTTLNRTSDDDFDEDGTTEGVQDEIHGLMAELGEALVAAELMTGNEEIGFTPKNNRVVSDKDSAGAVYNFRIVYGERSWGIHNTEYIVGLLKSSLNYIATGDPSGVAPRDKRDLLTAH